MLEQSVSNQQSFPGFFEIAVFDFRDNKDNQQQKTTFIQTRIDLCSYIL